MKRILKNGQSKIKKMNELKMEGVGCVLLLQLRVRAAFSPIFQPTISILCNFGFLWITITVLQEVLGLCRPVLRFWHSVPIKIFSFFQWLTPLVRPRSTGTSIVSSSFPFFIFSMVLLIYHFCSFLLYFIIPVIPKLLIGILWP